MGFGQFVKSLAKMGGFGFLEMCKLCWNTRWPKITLTQKEGKSLWGSKKMLVLT
jgi:hypothetical protein